MNKSKRKVVGRARRERAKVAVAVREGSAAPI